MKKLKLSLFELEQKQKEEKKEIQLFRKLKNQEITLFEYLGDNK